MSSERPIERRARRSVVTDLVGLTIVFAAALALVLPLMQGERFAFLAGVPVVILDITLLASALGWLAWYVWRPSLRRRGPEESPGLPR